MAAPTVIQLNHRDPIPLKIYLVPDLDIQKTTIFSAGDHKWLPSIEIVSIKMRPRSKIKTRCRWGSQRPQDQYHTFRFPFQNGLDPVAIPVISEAESGSSVKISLFSWPPPNNPPMISKKHQYEWAALQPIAAFAPPSKALDLGTRFSVVLGSSASSVLHQAPVAFKRKIIPTFSTYNISVTHRLEWRIVLSCAGRTHAIRGGNPVTVLAQSEEQKRGK
ncbi:hypothetical protein MMC34_001669 [Xylographa carneopallida]|nr:hypothetical protein [Xylographa carneopallida]